MHVTDLVQLFYEARLSYWIPTSSARMLEQTRLKVWPNPRHQDLWKKRHIKLYSSVTRSPHLSWGSQVTGASNVYCSFMIWWWKKYTLLPIMAMYNHSDNRQPVVATCVRWFWIGATQINGTFIYNALEKKIRRYVCKYRARNRASRGRV